MLLESKIGAVCQKLEFLESKVDYTAARLAEETDGRINTQAENKIIVHGLSRLSGDRTSQKSQASTRVHELFARIFPAGSDGQPQFLIVNTNYFDSERPTVECTMQTSEMAIRLRKQFGTLPLATKQKSGLSFFNSLTIGTRVRVSILRAISSRYQEINPGAQSSVTSYVPRPYLRLRQNQGLPFRNLRFVEAIAELKPMTEIDCGGLGMKDSDFRSVNENAIGK